MKDVDRVKIIQLMEALETNIYVIRERSKWAESELEKVKKILEKQGEGDYGVGARQED